MATVLLIDYWRAGASSAPTATKEGVTNERASPGREGVYQKVVVDNAAFDRISELERQLREMKDAKAVAPATSAAPDEGGLSLEEARRQVEEMYAELDREHEQDPADAEWAPRATQHLVAGLTTLGEKVGFTVGAVDCKTTTCRGTVTWTNYAAARSAAAQLVEESYEGLNCEQKIYLQDPADPNASYSANLYLDCTDLRAGVADAFVAAGPR